MKKFLAVLLVLMMLLAFTACDDGKCDVCDEPAVDAGDAGVDGEYCAEHLAEEVLKLAAEELEDMLG